MSLQAEIDALSFQPFGACEGMTLDQIVDAAMTEEREMLRRRVRIESGPANDNDPSPYDPQGVA